MKYYVYDRRTTMGAINDDTPEEFTNLKYAWQRAYQLSGGINRRETMITKLNADGTQIIVGGYVAKNDDLSDVSVQKVYDETAFPFWKPF